MMAPDKTILLAGRASQGEPHQGRLGQVEAPAAVGAQKALQRLVAIAKASPIFLHDGQLCLPVHYLDRPLKVIPVQGSTQDRMSVNDQLPRLLPCFHFKVAADGAADLLVILSQLRRQESMKKQSLLQW